MDPVTIDKTKDLILAINEVRTIVFVIAGLFALLGFIGYLIYLKHKSKLVLAEQAAVEARQKEKAERALQYTRSLDGLSNAVATSNTAISTALSSFESTLKSHKSSNDAVNALTVTTLGKVYAALEGLSKSNGELASKLTAKLSVADSVEYLRRIFLSEIYHSVYDIVRKAIVDNGYEDNKDFISNKVRTDIASVLRSCRADVIKFEPLTVRVQDFFELETEDPTIERFVLCNLLWAKAESYLVEGISDSPKEHNALILKRVDDAKFAILNIVQDHFSARAHASCPGTDSRSGTGTVPRH